MSDDEHTHDTSLGSVLGRAFVVLVILVFAGGMAYYLITHKEQSKKGRPHETVVTTVETIKSEKGDYPATIEGMGQVVPAVETDLKAQISGEIVKVSPEFVPGGFFTFGEDILHIDDSDYQLDLKVKQAALEQAQASLNLEMGRQSIAKDELKILEQSTGKSVKGSDLALRKPQLAQARANLDSAKASLELAELNLKRTVLSAPFNALVVDRIANLGDKVSSQGTLAKLVSTDKYWIELALPVNNLRWLDFPGLNDQDGSPALIMLDGGRGSRKGHLIKTTGTLDAQSRLATVIISIPDPLALSANMEGQTPMILGDYVRVKLTGKSLGDVVRLPRDFLREGNKVWVDEQDVLKIKPVTVVFEDSHYAYISKGLQGGEDIVASNIPVPVEGMPLRNTDTPAADKSSDHKEVAP